MPPRTLTDGEREVLAEIEQDCRPMSADPELEEPTDDADYWRAMDEAVAQGTWYKILQQEIDAEDRIAPPEPDDEPF